MNLQDLHLKAMNVMAGFFTEHGTLPPIFIGLDTKMDLHILGCPEYTKKREFYGLIISGYFYVYDVTAYAYASEAWAGTGITTPDGKLPKDFVMPSKDPKRKEVLVTGAIDRDNMVHKMFRIMRDKRGHGSIGPEHDPWKGVDKGEVTVAREGLCGMLEQKGPDDPAGRAAITIMVEETIRRDYFTPCKILKPAEYEEMRN